MRVEREIAGFAFPFAAGVIAAVLSGGSPCIIKPTYHLLALTFTLSSAILMLHPMRRSWSERVQWYTLVFCTLTCGLTIGMCGVELEISAIGTNGWLHQIAQSAGEGMIRIIDSIEFKESSTNAVIKALLTGDRSDISSDISRAFRDSGASHILALSGLHLGIIYGIVSKIISITGNSTNIRRIRSLIIISICGLYTLATGAGASIMRAYIFIVIKEIADMTGRHTSLKGILATSLTVHLTFNPMAAKDIGFQLSYAAMLGIAFIFPYLKSMWKNDWKVFKWIWKSAALSISCQITTGPLAYYYFKTFPQHFLLTNLLTLPLTGVTIPAALLTTIMTSAGWCPKFLIATTEWLTQVLLEVLKIIAVM